MSGVKQFLKPDAYKQSELQGSVIRDQGSEPMAATPKGDPRGDVIGRRRGASLAAAVLMTDS
jgi:hypothetical protein